MQAIIPVFIASPNDVKSERKFVHKAINDLSSRLLPLLEIVLTPVRWQDFAPIAEATSEEVFQDRIIRRLEACGIFVGILYKRYGTSIDENRDISGTEAEFEFAIKHRERIKILTYFRQYDLGKTEGHTQEEIDQLHKVNKLKNKLNNIGLPYQPYKTPAEFGKRIALDLMEAVLEITNEATRRDCLRKFFKFGLSHKEREPSVMIAYPAIHKHHGSSAQANYDWQKRLLPNVVYEDFKAIQKIESALHCIGVTNYSSVTTSHPKLRLSPGNRIWLCIPRNELAQDHLESLGNRTWFLFKGDTPRTRHIVWKPPWLPKHNPGIIVYSPLAKYLRKQRPKDRQRWDPEFGYIFARDFAIIARFKLDEYSPVIRSRPFYHYFIAGIRGLGTWGVGWNIDRHPDFLAHHSKEQSHGDVQVLLQVTYENFRIKAVTDVSKCDQAYFDEQMDTGYIKRMVDKHKKKSKPSK